MSESKADRNLQRWIASIARLEGFRMTRAQAINRLLALVPEHRPTDDSKE